jgi:transcriptional regulator with GAF, ATPase, and Fis domain
MRRDLDVDSYAKWLRERGGDKVPGLMESARGTPNEGLDPAHLWEQLQRLVERTTALGNETAVDDSLDIVVELSGADRGLVLLEQEDGTTVAVNARGPRRALTPSEREEVSHTIIRSALEANSFFAWSEDDQPVGASSAISLGIVAAMVAPLRADGVRRGMLYVDFRGRGAWLDRARREFFIAAAALMGGMLGYASANRVVVNRLATAENHLTESRQTPPLDELLRHPGMRQVSADMKLALAGDSPVLFLGESGSGKTLLAQALAEASGRRPIVRVVLGGSDDLNTITSELFGHERGAFSGAIKARVGLVEYAHGGTLLLDEVLNLPPQGQKLLLDFTQFGTYRPLGHDRPEPKRAQVRIVAATNGDIRAAMREGRFREDLYYRLAGVTVRVPPLRERREDIPALALGALLRADASRKWSFSLDLRRALASDTHPWSGNVRELEWMVRRARDRACVRDPRATEIGLSDFGELGLGERVERAQSSAKSEGSSAEAWQRLQEQRTLIDQREADILRETLERHEGVIAHAAKELGLARTTLAGRMEALRMPRKGPAR